MTRTAIRPRPRSPVARMLESPDAGTSSAPEEIDGQEVMVHKKVNLFPRGQGQDRG